MIDIVKNILLNKYNKENRFLLMLNLFRTTEIITHISKKAIDKIKNPVDDFLIGELMIKGIYKQWYLFH